MSCQRFNLDLSYCLLALKPWCGSCDSAWFFPDSVSLNFISCFFSFRVPLILCYVCFILWPFSGLCSTMPTSWSTVSVRDIISYKASISLIFPAPHRWLRSSSAHLWWRLKSLLSSSIFPLMVCQVGRFESVFKPSFFSSVIFFSACLHFPLRSIADYNQEFFRLPPKSISYADWWAWIWTLRCMYHFGWVTGLVKISCQLQRPQRTIA